MKKSLKSVLSVLLCGGLLAACTSNPSSPGDSGTAAKDSTAKTATPAAPKLAKPTEADFAKGPIKVRYWSVFSGVLAEAVDGVIADFNASQKNYIIEREFQGNATEIMAKLQASSKNDLPGMFTGAVENVGYFVNSGYTKSIQDFIDADPGGIDLTKTYPHLVSSYSDGKSRMVGYPIGNSFAGIFYNAKILKDAGIDPAKIKSYPDMYEAAKKIVNGGFAKYGVGFHKHGYYLNAALAVEGVPSFDKNNGYDGIPTKAVYDTAPTKDSLRSMLGVFQKLYSEKLAVPYGANENDEVVPLFSKGELGMFHGVISFYTRILATGGDKLDIGMIPMPSASEKGKNTGVPAGGTGNFITDNGNNLTQWGAYEFMKFAARADQQANFATKTGYLPVGSGGAETAKYQAFVKEKFPRVQVALDAQKNGDKTTKTPFVPIANELLKANLTAVEQVANDPKYNIDKAIADAQAAITDAIQLWSLANKK
jgi:sn-glycerol 3-phosphate transport system substrate-binding protein